MRLEVPGQRYGTANEPPPRVGGVGQTESAGADIIPGRSLPKYSRIDTKDRTNDERLATNLVRQTPQSGPDIQDSKATRTVPQTQSGLISNASPVDHGPLETVLEVESPSMSETSSKPPHIDTPPFVHNFDTYTMVRNLQRGGFTESQAVTAMKALRILLTENMDLAKEGLVSKSNVENETYLFRAACSELRTEIQNNRKFAAERMRTERNQLQYEVDILNQKLTQESSNLKEELRGMFDDRKMAVKMEQRGMESKIQELHYRITVALNSDARSEIEGLRWVLTRRAAFAIAISALMILATLRYSSYMAHSHELERKQTSSTGTQTDAGNERGAEAGADRMGVAYPVRRSGPVPGNEPTPNAPVGEGSGYISLG